MELFWLEQLLVKSCSCTQDLWEFVRWLSSSITLVLWRYEPVLFGFFSNKDWTNKAFKMWWWYVNYLAQEQIQSTQPAPTCCLDFNTTALKNWGQTRISSANESFLPGVRAGRGKQALCVILLQHRKGLIAVGEHQTDAPGKERFSYHLQKSCLFQDSLINPEQVDHSDK